MLQYERKFCRKSQNVYRIKAQEFKHVRYSVLAPYLPMSFLKNTLLRSSDSGCSRTFPTKLFCVASTCGNSGKNLPWIEPEDVINFFVSLLYFHRMTPIILMFLHFDLSGLLVTVFFPVCTFHFYLWSTALGIGYHALAKLLSWKPEH